MSGGAPCAVAAGRSLGEYQADGHGVAVGVGVGDEVGRAVGEGVGEAVAVGEGVTDCVGVAEGAGVVGTGVVTRKAAPSEPPAGAGLTTLTAAGPAAAISCAGIKTVSWLAENIDTTMGAPFQRTCD